MASDGKRPPLNQGAFPAPQRAPSAVQENEQCAALPALRAAYYSLMAGGQTQQVRDGDRWQSFHPGNVRELKTEIRRLEIMCDPVQSRRAVQAGRHPSAPYGGFGYRFGCRWPY